MVDHVSSSAPDIEKKKGVMDNELPPDGPKIKKEKPGNVDHLISGDPSKQIIPDDKQPGQQVNTRRG